MRPWLPLADHVPVASGITGCDYRQRSRMASGPLLSRSVDNLHSLLPTALVIRGWFRPGSDRRFPPITFELIRCFLFQPSRPSMFRQRSSKRPERRCHPAILDSVRRAQLQTSSRRRLMPLPRHILLTSHVAQRAHRRTSTSNIGRPAETGIINSDGITHLRGIICHAGVRNLCWYKGVGAGHQRGRRRSSVLRVRRCEYRSVSTVKPTVRFQVKIRTPALWENPVVAISANMYYLFSRMVGQLNAIGSTESPTGPRRPENCVSRQLHG